MNSKPQAIPPEERKSPLELARRRALYRALHRGTREMDFLLGRFARAEVESMDMEELAILERLMSHPETMLEKLLSPASHNLPQAGQSPASDDPDDDELAMAARIRSFHRHNPPAGD